MRRKESRSEHYHREKYRHSSQSGRTTRVKKISICFSSSTGRVIQTRDLIVKRSNHSMEVFTSVDDNISCFRVYFFEAPALNAWETDLGILVLLPAKVISDCHPLLHIPNEKMQKKAWNTIIENDGTLTRLPLENDQVLTTRRQTPSSLEIWIRRVRSSKQVPRSSWNHRHVLIVKLDQYLSDSKMICVCAVCISGPGQST